MANLQSYFIAFHDVIKLEYEDNSVLREKRDEILETLKNKITSVAESYEVFHQGSYSMYTGIKPLEDGDYDIDVGLLFSIAKDDYPNPVTIKKWVYNALEDDYPNIEMKQPCITVKFENEDEDDDRNFHIDFAIYSSENSDEKTYLAKGKLNSNSEYRNWEHSDPKELVRTIKEYLSDEKDRKQFRRVIRYLKRWKDLKFKGIVNRPSGIGLTVAGLTHFQPKYESDYFTNTRTYNDLHALEVFVQNMIDAFKWRYNEESVLEERLEVVLPTPPYNDIYKKMSGNQMSDFKTKLESLLNSIQDAKEEVDPVKACEILEKEFGEDFPIPSKTETAQKRGPAIMTDHSSA